MKMPEELVTSKIGRKFWIYRDDKFYRQRVANVGPYQKRNLLRMRELVPNARTILDVGMNIGMNTIEYATWAMQVHGFEPTKQTFDMAVKNIELAKKQKAGLTGWHKKPDGTFSSCAITGNIAVYPIAIGREDGERTLIYKKNNAGQNYIGSGNGDKVVMRALDSMGIRDVDAIKIDVEGFEYEVLLGAAKLIERYRPVVQLEILEQHAKRFGITPQTIYDWFLERDYTITLCDGADAGTEWQKFRNMMDRFFIPR